MTQEQKKQHVFPVLSAEPFGVQYPALRCPKCPNYYIHHGTVTVFDRKAEYSEHGLATTLNDGGVRVAASMAGNPSSNRSGMRIRFWCESCDEEGAGDMDLVIQQHKGLTFVYWERAQ